MPHRVIRPGRIKTKGIQELAAGCRFSSDPGACLELNPSDSFCSPVQLHPKETLVLPPPAALEHLRIWDEVVGKAQHGAALTKETSAQPRESQRRLCQRSPPQGSLWSSPVSLLHGELLDREIKPGPAVAAQNAGDVYGKFSTDNAQQDFSVCNKQNCPLSPPPCQAGLETPAVTQLSLSPRWVKPLSQLRRDRLFQ